MSERRLVEKLLAAIHKTNPDADPEEIKKAVKAFREELEKQRLEKIANQEKKTGYQSEGGKRTRRKRRASRGSRSRRRNY